MFNSTVLTALSPLLLLIIVAGLVVIVALVRAKPEDVPTVLQEGAGLLRRLAKRIPNRHNRILPPDRHHGDDDVEEVTP